MTRKDRKLNETLKRAFPTQREKEKQLCDKILLQLPERNNRSFVSSIVYTLFSCIIFMALVLNTKTILNTVNTITIFFHHHQIPDKESIVAVVMCVTAVTFLIWQIYCIIDDYYLLKNEDIITRALKQKRE